MYILLIEILWKSVFCGFDSMDPIMQSFCTSTAQLSWHVQNGYMIGWSFFALAQRVFLQGLDYELLISLW